VSHGEFHVLQRRLALAAVSSFLYGALYDEEGNHCRFPIVEDIAMRTCTASLSPSCAVEITLSGQQVVESHVTTLHPDKLLPDEVMAAGPAAVEGYLEYLERQPASMTPGLHENITFSAGSEVIG
jgi:hypothetical protein